MGNLAVNLEPRSTRAQTTDMVERLRDSNQDFEWYPTTQAMIDTIKADMREYFLVREDEGLFKTVLDCGAGDGRVLEALTDGSRYAIEKARPLLDSMDCSVFVVGTDFHAQTLLDKKTDVLFSNPPYSEYRDWMLKILKEAYTPVAYLIVPKRWKEDEVIGRALEARNAQVSVLDELDFTDADRAARAQVQVVRVDLAKNSRAGFMSREKNPDVDPFQLWFEENFPLNVNPDSYTSSMDSRRRRKERMQEELDEANEMVESCGLVGALERLYQKDMDHLLANYQKLCDMDSELLRELDVNLKAVRSGLKLKIENLKDQYWQELFDNLSTLTDRLTSESRQKMLETLTAHTHIDFQAANCHAVVSWAAKNASAYYNDQLIRIVENMVNKANIELYRSNQTTFGEEMWRYGRKPENLERYSLDYRIVLHHIGGISTERLLGLNPKNGLERRATDFVDDLRVIATNLGFDTFGFDGAAYREWESGKKMTFWYQDHVAGEQRVLMEVRAYKNGNLHIKFAPALIQSLNIEFGRLKGWLKTAEQAASELDIDAQVAQHSFGVNYQIEASSAIAALTDQRT